MREQLTYDITDVDGETVVTFNRTPNGAVIRYLHTFGFHCQPQHGTVWRGPMSERESIQTLCRRAAAQSLNPGAAIYDMTLCWACAKAAGARMRECPWADRFEPVPGWDAEYTERTVTDCSTRGGRTVRGTHVVRSYQVNECPLYEPDPPRKKRRKRKWSL